MLYRVEIVRNHPLGTTLILKSNGEYLTLSGLSESLSKLTRGDAISIHGVHTLEEVELHEEMEQMRRAHREEKAELTDRLKRAEDQLQGALERLEQARMELDRLLPIEQMYEMQKPKPLVRRVPESTTGLPASLASLDLDSE